MTIVTATRNPSEVFFTRTVRFVLEQSLQAFRWVVVNDQSTEASSLRRLNELKQWAEIREPHRIMVVDNPSSAGQGNGPAAMNYGLTFVGDSPFVAILDDDDMWELTTLEKAALVMSWVPDAYAVSFDVVNHGDKEFLWKRGFYNGDESFFNENNMMQGSPFRSIVLQKCRFREDMADGGADWDFWMCMASHGMWGLHVPENGNWYQWNPHVFRQRRWKAVTTPKGLEDTRARIQQRYPNLMNEDAWPPIVLPLDLGEKHGRADIEDSRRGFKDQAPFANPVGLRVEDKNIKATHKTCLRCILLALRELGNNTASDQAQIFTRMLAAAGWRVTVLLTHYLDADESTTRRHQQLLQYTHDVFVAGIVAPLDKMPDLVAYLIESRGIDVVVLLPDRSSSSQIILRHLVAASLRGARTVANQPNVQRRPITVIDAGPMGDEAKCADKESEGQCCAKISNPRNEIWLAVMRPSDDANRNAKTKDCLTRRGYATVIMLPETREETETTASHVIETIVQALIQATDTAGASHPFHHNDGPLVHMELWSAFIERFPTGSVLMSSSQKDQDRGLDMRQIQWALQYRKKRYGIGREFQIACPERVYGNGRWLDALEAPISCGISQSDALNVSSLRANALRQCGSWCLVNFDAQRAEKRLDVLFDGSVLGWEFFGSCFRPIKSVDASSRCRRDFVTALVTS
jgi:hypothetical protein